MKRNLAIVLAICLIASLISVAYASGGLHSKRMLCISASCGGAHTIHYCQGEQREAPVQVECPDAIVNCYCEMIVTYHEYQCEMCGLTRLISETVYHHSK